MQDQTRGLFPALFSGFVFTCFSSVFTRFSFLTPHSRTLPAPVFGGWSSSCHGASVFCWLFSLIFSSVPPFFPLLCAYVVSLLFLLHYLLLFFPLRPPASLPHITPPSVLWKLSPLWGCLAEDHSPCAPAVPLKVTQPRRICWALWQVAMAIVRISRTVLPLLPVTRLPNYLSLHYLIYWVQLISPVSSQTLWIKQTMENESKSYWN